MPVHPLLLPAWLASASLGPTELAPDEVEAVELPWARYEALRASAHEDPSATAPGPWVAERQAELRRVDGGWDLRVTWTIEAETPGWLWTPLAGAGIEVISATWEGRRAPVVSLPGGSHLAAFVERSTRLELRAFVPGSLDQPVALDLMPATRGRLRVVAPGRVPVPVVDETSGEAPPVLDGGIVWSGSRATTIALRDPDRAPPTRDTLAVAHAGVGLTVGDAELRGRAHLQWELRHGTLEEVRATVAGLGDDLTVAGRNLASWSREGDALVFQLSSPASGRVDLDLQWTQAVPASDEANVALPTIEPQAWRNEQSLQVARDGELEVIPRADDWTAIASSELPDWGQGLVEGTPTAAYRSSEGPGGGSLDLLRFVPVPGPPTVVDVASYTMATTEEGRVLMRAHYELRNDRGAHLTVRPPPGLRIIGARVAGETALPSRDEGGAWRLPLKRSLETVEGLLSFPVEVIMLGEQDPWERRELRELPLPTLDAPIAASRVTLHLPPRYRSKLEVGEHNVVDEFAEGEGLTYGLGVGNVGSAAADALFQEAVEGYMRNDFVGAQAKLEQLEELGVRNENMTRLQSNIDVIEGKDEADDKADVALQRRVKEQARARAVEQFRQQEVLIEEAERAASSGDYAAAEAQYQAALELGGELAKLEQSESVELDTRNEALEAELKTVATKSEKKRGRKKKKGKGRPSKAPDMLETSFYDPTPDPEPTDDFSRTKARVPPEHDEPPAQANEDGNIVTGKQITLEEPPLEEIVVEEEEMPEPEPEPMAGPMEIDEADRIAFEGEPIVAAKMSRRGRFRRRGGVRFKRTKNRRFGRKGAAGGSSGVAVYDFEDDSLDGEILRPEGASVSSRARGSAPPLVTTPTDITIDDTGIGTDGQGSYGALADEDAADAPDSVTTLDALPAPEVTASALSVVIPAAGEAVRYEQLLIEANQTQTITIDARRRLRSR